MRRVGAPSVQEPRHIGYIMECDTQEAVFGVETNPGYEDVEVFQWHRDFMHVERGQPGHTPPHMRSNQDFTSVGRYAGPPEGLRGFSILCTMVIRVALTDILEAVSDAGF